MKINLNQFRHASACLGLAIALLGGSRVLKAQGTVIGWGNNGYGQATPPAGLNGVVGIAAGQSHNLALKSDGTVVGWGDNSYGQATPPAGLSGVVGIAGAYWHSLALKSDGTVVGWGTNFFGEMMPPAGLSGVVKIGTGTAHSLALKSDGTVVAWGDNVDGQSTPPAGLSGVVAIAAGSYFNLALKSNGTVVGWGDNWTGQATPPTGLTNVVAIAAGSLHSLALKSDGTVVGWGDNSNGEATPPAGLRGVVRIAAGESFSLALKSDGTVVGWGSNIDGRATPPARLMGVVGIAAGGFDGLALDRATANLLLTPDSGVAGTPITATGDSFEPYEKVIVRVGAVQIGTGIADVNGTVTVTGLMPAGPYGPNLVYAGGRSSGRYGHGVFSVTPRLIANPNAGTPGSTVAVQGYGFGVGEAVNVYWFNSGVLVGTATADARGSFPSLTFTIPMSAPQGTKLVLGKGQSTGSIGKGYITVQ